MTLSSDDSQTGERSSRRAPAPWALRGDGYVLMLRTSALPDDPAVRRGPFAVALFAEYASSPVGPYRELLFIPGAVNVTGRTLPTISKIYVSTQASAENGRANWGIPKELAVLGRERKSERLDRLTVRLEDQIVVDLTVEKVGPSLPFWTWMIPSVFRTLGQALDGQRFVVAPRATGRMRWARVKHAWSDGEAFPPLSVESIAGVIAVRDVALTFPEAEQR